ncbi:outer membrane protein transport protein [Parabacteroides goldsteinii]|uniref:outer membrane protein transport protein n=1 Tax=Parabacteroides goldsteinii TaxID=328812 RepID=UPI0025981B99|nr:outer membrane protein transport protein [Parabacteroides goldsteinii]
MKKVIALACLSMLPMSYAAAEGYQVNAQSTKQAGMGHVGVAMKLGAESMHFNPAGLVFMDKNVDLSAGITGVFANGKFTGDDGYVQKNG